MRVSHFFLFTEKEVKADVIFVWILDRFRGSRRPKPAFGKKTPVFRKTKIVPFFSRFNLIFLIPYFIFSRYPILRKTKRDIGKIKRAIIQIKREIISIKRALVATKRALGQTPSPLPWGGSAANWDKNALRFSPIRGCREGFRETFLFALALNERESAI